MSPASSDRERGSAAVEFVMVSIVVVALVLAVIQVAVYLHARNVLAASAAEGARYGANAEVAASAAGPKAEQIARTALGGPVSAGLRCTSALTPGAGGLVLVSVDCSAPGPLVLGWLGSVLDIDVRARAVKEGQGGVLCAGSAAPRGTATGATPSSSSW